ncbi:hypothetical protein LZ838_03480 [Pseudomonas sp. AA27]|uniref:hypothetical protein n=1 Tax=Pseudomonas sp. AA27 TaxID=2908652 RepID=UPI001F2D4389|nr:hypothetical protein [Pseudomonas sp. AA27]MCF1486423.1 hypothetical protein [Pseudomonas sp. AA27]
MCIKNYLAFAVTMSAASSAFAAMTANVEIAGKVIPTACGIVASQAKIDLGDIKPDSNGKVAEITRALGTLTVTCAAPTRMQLSYTNTAPVGSNALLPAGWVQDGKGIANMQLMPSKTTVDNVAGALLYSPNATGDRWSTVSTTDYIPLSNLSNRLSFSNTTSTTPQAMTTAVVELSAKFAEITKANFSNGPIRANQTLTFELKYL